MPEILFQKILNCVTLEGSNHGQHYTYTKLVCVDCSSDFEYPRRIQIYKTFSDIDKNRVRYNTPCILHFSKYDTGKVIYIEYRDDIAELIENPAVKF